MARVLDIAPRIAIFLAGIAAGVLTSRRDRTAADPQAAQDVERLLADVEKRLAAQATAQAATHDERFTKIEAKLDEHETKLASVPTTSEIVAAMEQLLARTMTSLDERLTSQAHSIDVLKTTVSQTDSLLERVLESLDTLQTYTDPADLSTDTLLRQTPV